MVLEEYKNGFDCLGSLKDAGGRTGGMIAEIVKAHPHIIGTDDAEKITNRSHSTRTLEVALAR